MKRLELRKSGRPLAKRRKVSQDADVPAPGGELKVRVTPDLQTWVQDYTTKNETTLAQMIKDHLVALRKKEQGDGVDQL